MIRWLSRLTRKLGPSWLVKDEVTLPDGEKVETDSRLLYTTELLADWALERLRLGILARFPGNGTMPADALRFAGRDRKIPRGPNEPQEVYELRLVGAVDKHRTRGNPWRLAEQLRAFCYPHAVRIRIWNDRGDVHTLERDGTTTSVVRDTAWDWDGLFGTGDPPIWTRFWVLIYPTTDTPQQPWRRPLWGEVTWGQFYWGSTATPADVQGVRAIVDGWKPEGTTCVHIMVVFNDADFDPTAAAPPLPDGTWGPWSKNSGGEQVPTRNTDVAYWPGTAGPEAISP